MKKAKSLKLLVFVMMAILAAIWILPILWIISTSLKPESQVIDPIVHWIPKEITFDNFKVIFADTYDAPILRWMLNSVIIALSHTLLILLFSSMAAFSFARLEFKGKEKLYWMIISTMMIPGVINFVPNYIIVNKLGWIDTPFAMIFPGLAGAFGVFLLRQFFEGLPRELDEAAYIDGASYIKLYMQIIIPLSKPALIALALFSFMANWNDFLWPILVTNDTFQRTLPAGLAIFQGKYTVEFGKLMSGAVISALPPLMMFLAFQKYFIEGIAFSGMKG